MVEKDHKFREAEKDSEKAIVVEGAFETDRERDRLLVMARRRGDKKGTRANT